MSKQLGFDFQDDPDARLEPYGFMIVIVLLATGILVDLMQPILRVAEMVLGAILGL